MWLTTGAYAEILVNRIPGYPQLQDREFLLDFWGHSELMYLLSPRMYEAQSFGGVCVPQLDPTYVAIPSPCVTFDLH